MAVSKTTKKSLRVPDYLHRMSSETAEELYVRVMNEIAVKKRYLDATFSAKQLARDLHTNTRYISALMSLRFDGTFNATVNRFRVERAIFYMKDKRYAELTCGEIGLSCGFANRQSFYSAFNKEKGMTPAAYRKEILAGENTIE